MYKYNRNSLWRFIQFFILVIFFAGFVVTNALGKSYNSQQSTSAVNVVVKKIVPTDVPIIVDSIGSLYAQKTITINPQISGQIKQVLFQYGQTVEKGQPLYQLDDKLYQAQYQAAKFALHISQINYERIQRLAKQRAISKQALDKALADYQAKKSDLKVIGVKLERMRILAPFTGVIGASQVNIGQFVEDGAPLVSLIDKADLVARFSIPEGFLDKVKLGQLVGISNAAFPKIVFHGKVSYISPSIDAKTRTLMIWATIPNGTMRLSPGLFVHVKLKIGIRNHVILIPQKALIPTVEDNDVYIIRADKAYKKSVIVGKDYADNVVIKDGLTVGEKVVVLGQEKLADGRLVRVISQ